MTPDQIEAQIAFAEAAGLEFSPPCDSEPCRFAANDPDHLCTNRDGRPVRAGTTCFSEARASMLDEVMDARARARGERGR